MLPIQKNYTRAVLGGLLPFSVAYFAGSKRCLKYLQGATRKELLGAASAGALANLIFRHEDPRKSEAISSAVSMLSVAATLKSLGKGSNWAPLTYLKLGAMQIALLGGVFDQPKLYYENGKLRYKVEFK